MQIWQLLTALAREKDQPVLDFVFDVDLSLGENFSHEWLKEWIWHLNGG